MVARGISISIGLNQVDPGHYAGWKGELVACEADAKDMAALAKKQGFATTTLLTGKATVAAVTSAIHNAAGELGDGDILLLTYSGHGGQVPDTNGDEDDRLDETWVLYDRQLVDDELYALWAVFAPGVRLVVLSDSCHSGTAVREVLNAVRPRALSAALAADRRPVQSMKVMPPDVAVRVRERHQALYDDIQKSVPSGDRADLTARVLLLSGCQDNQTSADGTRNGLFTQTVKAVWNGGAFKGGYRSFWKDVVAAMPPWQSPGYYPVNDPGRVFARERPFTI